VTTCAGSCRLDLPDAELGCCWPIAGDLAKAVGSQSPDHPGPPSQGGAAVSSASQPGMSRETISRLGECGLIVPANTVMPSCNRALANSLASASLVKVLVSRGLRGRGSKPRLRISQVTYQVAGQVAGKVHPMNKTMFVHPQDWRLPRNWPRGHCPKGQPAAYAPPCRQTKVAADLAAIAYRNPAVRSK
jgi:hypothetical protein